MAHNTIELTPVAGLGNCMIIDPLEEKTCNFDCVYCPLGTTIRLTNERVYSPPPKQIFGRIRDRLPFPEERLPDWVLFKATGEPTLHIGFGWLLGQVNELMDVPIAVLTNGGLLSLPEMRAELSQAHVVLLRLDAGSQGMYDLINRPHPELRFHDLLRGISAFREDYGGQIWVQLTLIKGANDDPLELERLGVVLNRLQPDEIHLRIPPETPPIAWVQRTDEVGLMRATATLGKIAPIRHPAADAAALKSIDDPTRAIFWLLNRHVMRRRELFRALDEWTAAELAEALAKLEAAGRVHRGQRYGDFFWGASGRMIPGEPHGVFPNNASATIGLTRAS